MLSLFYWRFSTTSINYNWQTTFRQPHATTFRSYIDVDCRLLFICVFVTCHSIIFVIYIYSVETGNNLHTLQLHYNWFYSLKVLAHFRPKILVDFLHSFTQINCLTGAITARHILRTIYLNNNYVILLHNSPNKKGTNLQPQS